MTNITLRNVKGSALTHAEMDQNFESLSLTVDAITTNYTILTTDQNKILECTITSGTITLPTVAAAAGVHTDSFRVWIKNLDATSLTVDGNGAETIQGAANLTLLTDESALISLNAAGTEWDVLATYGPNLLGITATPTEINTVLDGATFTAAEGNYLDLTTGPGTAEASRALVLDASSNITAGVNSFTATTLTGTTINQGANNVVDDSDIGVTVQAYSARLVDIAALTATDSNFIVGNGTTWVVESGATVRTSLGLGSLATASTVNNDDWSGTDLAVVNGGTGSSTAAGARTNIGIDGTSGNIAAGDVAANAIGSNKIINTVDNIYKDISIAANATVSITENGPINIQMRNVGTASLVMEVFFLDTWLVVAETTSTNGTGRGLYSTGSNVRIREINNATGARYSLDVLSDT